MKGFGDSGRNEDLDGAGIGGVKLRSGEASNRTRERSESNSGLWTVFNKVISFCTKIVHTLFLIFLQAI